MATKTSEVSGGIGIHPVAGTLGAEISGVDLSQTLNDATVAEINQALLDNLVIFFRNQHITPDQQIAFARRFGELHIHPYIPSLEGYPEVLALTSKADGPGDYAYQVRAGRICVGSSPVQSCDDDDDCEGVACVLATPDYTLHFTVESCQEAACCVNETCIVTNKLDCLAQQGNYLGDGDQPVVSCQEGACTLGSLKRIVLGKSCLA